MHTHLSSLPLPFLLTALSIGAAACASLPPGPASPYEVEARPMSPDQFVTGTGEDLPTPFADVRSQALASGVSGMADYAFSDWVTPTGTLSVAERDGRTVFEMAFEGLVPGGLYTTWIVRPLGSSRGMRGAMPLGVGYGGEASAGGPRGSNALVPGPSGRATHTVRLAPDFADALDRTYEGIAMWDEIHVAFHADHRGYGHRPGPSHWVQLVVGLDPKAEGAARLPLSPRLDADVDLGAALATAEAAGLAAAATYTEDDWRAAAGAITHAKLDLGVTDQTSFLVTASGLIPGGAYTARLVADGGRACPIGEHVPGDAGARGTWSAQLDVDATGDGFARAQLTPQTGCAAGAFGALADWSRVEIAFHPDQVVPDVVSAGLVQLEVGL